MSFVFIVSILLKGIGAALEVLLQVVITRKIGVTKYGSYSTFINIADLIYWCLFSGLVKCNTFYLAEIGTNIRKFKKKYFGYYVLPICGLGFIASIIMGRYIGCIVFAITLAELLVMDQSSTFMARKYSKRALFGEYVLGRFLLLIGVAILFSFSITDVSILMIMYLLQFLLIEVYFFVQKKGMPRYKKRREVSLKKWGNYQRADIIQSMIAQMPVILQYILVGSFEAGVVSVVMLVKKLVNFISGPSFKIFLPEFSRLYKIGDKNGIKKSYESIIRMQMLFLAPMSVVLVGFPNVLLQVMADELIEYSRLFILCSIIFILVASLGPCSGLMQMTGNEHWDNRFREIAFVSMFITFILLRKDPFFILYGLCVQTVIENTGKIIFISRWMGGFPMKLINYMKLWLLPALLILFVKMIHIQNSFIMMMVLSGITFIINLIIDIREENLLDVFKKTN